MKNLIKSFFSLLIIMQTFNLFASVTIDDKHVYNVENNSTIKCFNGLVSEVNKFNNEYNLAELKLIEKSVTDWINNSQEGFYLKDFNTDNFYWQFVEHTFGENKNNIGLILIIPEDEIRDEFYSVLGGGLRIPGTRCFDVPWTWVNDGEIFSFVIDKKSKNIIQFTNWRSQQDPNHNEPYLAYYSPLKIDFNRSVNLETINLLVFVDGKFRDSIDVSNNEDVLLPKGKLSTLVFYENGSIKGVMCFNMENIGINCPLYFRSSVSMKNRFGTDKILYSEPKCQDIYKFELLGVNEFDELTGIPWESLINYNQAICQLKKENKVNLITSN